MAKLREEIAVQKAKETELNKTIHITGLFIILTTENILTTPIDTTMSCLCGTPHPLKTRHICNEGPMSIWLSRVISSRVEI